MDFEELVRSLTHNLNSEIDRCYQISLKISQLYCTNSKENNSQSGIFFRNRAKPEILDVSKTALKF
jgi:hypothetical protein